MESHWAICINNPEIFRPSNSVIHSLEWTHLLTQQVLHGLPTSFLTPGWNLRIQCWKEQAYGFHRTPERQSVKKHVELFILKATESVLSSGYLKLWWVLFHLVGRMSVSHFNLWSQRHLLWIVTFLLRETKDEENLAAWKTGRKRMS